MPLLVRKSVDTAPHRFEIATDSGVVAVDLRRHPRARNYTLRVAGPARSPVLTMPRRGSLSEAHQFLDRHSGWLQRQIDRLPQPRPIAAGAFIPLRGAPHLIRHEPGRRGTVAIDNNGHDPMLIVAGGTVHLRRRVIDFLKREARRDLEAAVLRHAAALGVRAKAIRLRDQVSRWGSCSTTGVLSFSWRLILAPTHILDYVAAHEVAHLKEMNHGPRFWALVRESMPAMDEAKRWLQIYGMDLHRYGAAAGDA